MTGFIDAWIVGIAAADADALAELFDVEALFIGAGPAVLHGREQVRRYYDRVPAGLRVQATILRATAPLPSLVHGVVDVVFTAPGVHLPGRLAISLVRRNAGWCVSQYHLAATPGRPG